MSKYTPPAVTLRDVMAALPTVLPPLAWRVTMYPTPGSPVTAHSAVELVWNHPDGSSHVWKRWGRTVSTGTPDKTFQPLLLAAHEAYGWLEGRSAADVLKHARWDVSMLPRHLGDPT